MSALDSENMRKYVLFQTFPTASNYSMLPAYDFLDRNQMGRSKHITRSRRVVPHCSNHFSVAGFAGKKRSTFVAKFVSGKNVCLSFNNFNKESASGCSP